MADDDPVEQFFRPRPAGAEGPGGPVADDSGSWDAVAVDDDRAQKVAVAPPRSGGRRARGAVSARAAVRRRRLVAVTAAASALVLAGSGAGWAFQEYFKGKVQTLDLDMAGGAPRGAMNILLAGVDKRDGMSAKDIKRLHLGKEAGARSDTMMMVHVSADHDEVTIVSLPRDTLVTIPAHKDGDGKRIGAQQGKLTWAYAFGGAQLMKDTVEDATGMRVDHYVEVDFAGFLKVVDAVGGVQICTPQPIDDKASGLKLTAGTHHVDGATALAFARVRHGLGEDIGRMQRQQEFLSALLSTVLGKLKDPGSGPKVLGALLESVRVDSDLKKNLDAYAGQFKDVSLGNVRFAKVPLDDPAGTAQLGGVTQSVVIWDDTAADRMFQRIDDDEPAVEPVVTPTSTAKPLTVAPKDVSVVVRNGVGTVGLARNATDGLVKAGFRASWVIGVVQRKDTRSTVIRYGPARADSARTLAASIPFAKLQKVEALGTGLEVVVGSAWAKPKEVEIPGAEAAKVETRTASDNLCKA
ncbi:LytR family transcriptional attenuator [Actinocorallia herbida]|uniref:LytR family transcriptional attenuator n=1 Tax=Actinocorallia herbida TaxID=58109 RepID=A0A3N1D997_9ACTN|nr:LCP family protein [Actinocorallia herbida]ROO90071.1 LytR family transcriptional attenuator [Actinocorallia herbida]